MVVVGWVIREPLRRYGIANTKYTTIIHSVARSSITFIYFITMQSVIFEYVNKDGDECISIWSMEYFITTCKNCKQIINALQRQHSEEDWEMMINARQNELFYMLCYAIKNNTKHVLYPN